jgi:hypothetical protein
MTRKHPDRSIVDVRSEKSYKMYLKRIFERHGWTAEREVYPDNSKKQVDIIAEHPSYGKYGIEAKYTNYGGSTPAHAHHQIIKKYREQRFDGKKILKWVYAPYYRLRSDATEPYHQPDPPRHTWVNELLMPFFNSHGIGYLDQSDLTIRFQDVATEYIVPIQNYFGAPPVDVEKIDNYVRRKRQEYDYR